MTRDTRRPRPWEAVNCTEAEWASFTEWEREQFEETSAASLAEFRFRVGLLGREIWRALTTVWAESKLPISLVLMAVGAFYLLALLVDP